MGISQNEIILEFEKPIVEMQTKINDLRELSNGNDLNIAGEIKDLQAKRDNLLRDTYQSLDPWQKTLVARHPRRPHYKDYVEQLIDTYMPLSGDRAFANDQAILGGMGRFRGHSVMVIGQEKGADMDTRVKHNFGMARPEGYRKAIRLMRLAEQFDMPIITFVDTAGAWPGIGAEQRGQAEAIAQAIKTCLDVKVPLISVIIGEGGSGGAIAIAAANDVIMLEHSIYSVISPEGCASILWRDRAHAQEAANALKLTAQSLYDLGVIETIVPEPLGGAHRQRWQAVESVGDAIFQSLTGLKGVEGDDLRGRRRTKFLKMGQLES